MIGIYKIESPNGKFYIGQSVNIKKRFATYKRNNIKSQRKLKNSFDKYGVSNHIFSILCECSLSDLNRLELYYSELYNSIGGNGLNIRQCGGSKGCLSKETKELIAKANTGRVVSNETKNKIRLKLLGNIPHNKGKKGSIAWNKGLSCSEDVKNKLRLKNTGKLGCDSYSAKKILQFDLNNNLIKEWNGAREVERETGFKCAVVNRCARKERKTAYSYIWQYK